eukprot:Nk52_evm1s746 gene=Nk52_evmTU1s746
MVLDIKENIYVQQALLEFGAGMVGLVSSSFVTFESRSAGLVGRWWAGAVLGLAYTSMMVRDMPSSPCTSAITMSFLIYHFVVGLTCALGSLGNILSSNRSIFRLLHGLSALAIHGYFVYKFYLILQKEDYLNKVALPEVTMMYKEVLSTVEALKKAKL